MNDEKSLSRCVFRVGTVRNFFMHSPDSPYLSTYDF